MKLPGEDEHHSMGIPMIYMIIGISAFILILLLVVVNNNKKNKGGSEYVKNSLQAQEEQTTEEEESVSEETSKLRAEDLDFWDMYPIDDGTSTASSENTDNELESETEEPAEEEVIQEDPATDGKHTLIQSADGTEEWVLISPYLEKNTYDVTGFSDLNGIKTYSDAGYTQSSIGLDVSKHTTAVNFSAVKSAGVDYVMIRVGARGYSTGKITLDENFVENMDEAVEAGLGIGVYFFSQAISPEEVAEEANFVIQNIAPYKDKITYPVAFDMESPSNVVARVDSLSRDDKTSITESFLNSVQAAGYVPMIYGNKEWLIKNIDLNKLQQYQVWLSQESDVPDYPYLFTMWQYTMHGSISGVSGDANLNISFVDYSDR